MSDPVDLNLDPLEGAVRAELDAKMAARELALRNCRKIIQGSSKAIRALHRGETSAADQLVGEVKQLIAEAEAPLAEHRDIYYAGFFYDDDVAGPRRLGRQKRLGEGNFTLIPNGLPGVEERLNVMYQGGVVEGRLSLNRWVEVCCTAPAKMFGLYPQKGAIAVGSDADIVVFDPNAPFTYSADTIHMNVDYTAYDGMEVSGRPTLVMSRGKVIVEGDTYVGTKGDGRYLKRGMSQLLIGG